MRGVNMNNTALATTIRIDVPFSPSLDRCPDCGNEQKFGSGYGRATCRACQYHAGSDLSQQWIDYCDKLTPPAGVEISFCHEAENSDDYWIEVTGTIAAIRHFAGALKGTINYADFHDVLDGAAHIIADGACLRASVPAHMTDDPEAFHGTIISLYPQPGMPSNYEVFRLDSTDAESLEAAIRERYCDVFIQQDDD